MDFWDRLKERWRRFCLFKKVPPGQQRINAKTPNLGEYFGQAWIPAGIDIAKNRDTSGCHVARHGRISSTNAMARMKEAMKQLTELFKLPEIDVFAVLCILLPQTNNDPHPYRKELIGICKKQDDPEHWICRIGSRMEWVIKLPRKWTINSLREYACKPIPENHRSELYHFELATTNDLLKLDGIALYQDFSDRFPHLEQADAADAFTYAHLFEVPPKNPAIKITTEGV